MKTIKGPAIFLAQFLGDDMPFNNLDSISKMGKRSKLQGHTNSYLG